MYFFSPLFADFHLPSSAVFVNLLVLSRRRRIMKIRMQMRDSNVIQNWVNNLLCSAPRLVKK
jgi:hypothetical protein